MRSTFMRRQAVSVISIGLSLLLLSSIPARAEDAFYRVPIGELKLAGATTLPAAEVPATTNNAQDVMEPAVWLDVWKQAGNGQPSQYEAYVAYVGLNTQFAAYNWSDLEASTVLVVRAPAGQDVHGRLYLPASDFSKLVGVDFVIPASAANPNHRDDFYFGKLQHYANLAHAHGPGAAWFRHQANETRKELNRLGAKTEGDIKAGYEFPSNAQDNNTDDFAGAQELQETFDVFSGGKALSENLQIDRPLLPGVQRNEKNGDNVPSVDISSLQGLTLKPIDWNKLIEGKHPDLDPLAACIPDDQYAVFFPSFTAFHHFLDSAEQIGSPAYEAGQSFQRDSQTRQRYQQQLCLPLMKLDDILAPKFVRALAVTGSDPYLLMGSDVAVLFDTANTQALQEMLWARMQASAKTVQGITANETTGKVNGVDYRGLVSSDRSVCAYLATLGDAVVVTNSLAELQRLTDVQAKHAKPLSAAPEYLFFRDRYARATTSPQGARHEIGFLVLSDAAIRQWCSPRWRIAESRRTRAAAALAEMQANCLPELVAGQPTKPVDITSEEHWGDMGQLQLTASGITSSEYGDLQFMTPIVELKLSKASPAEAKLYNQWRDSYQQDWAGYMDPIAVQFTEFDGGLGADLTVTPLILDSDYSDVADASRGAHIAPGTGDPHDDMLHVWMALNLDSAPMQQVTNLASTFLPELKVNVLGWMGQTVAVYVDDDPVWKEISAAKDPVKSMGDNFERLPIAVYAQYKDGLKLAAFLTGLHAFVEQSAPGMTVWAPATYHDQRYVKISLTGEGKKSYGIAQNVGIYYTTAGGALLITPSEALLKRAIDRALDRQKAATAPSSAPAATQPQVARDDSRYPLLGENLSLRIDAQKVMHLLLMKEIEADVQAKAWKSLPILNEWKRLFPNENPVALQERLWHDHLLDPAGGKYQWNEQFHTMESENYGSPADPKSGPEIPPALQRLLLANFGITLESQGLRAKMDLNLAPASK